MAMSSASQEYGYTSPKLAKHKRITVTQGRSALTRKSNVSLQNEKKMWYVNAAYT